MTDNWRQTTNVPVDEASTLCQCGESVYWKIGDETQECECGHLYYKGDGLGLASTYGYLRYLLVNVNLDIIKVEN